MHGTIARPVLCSGCSGPEQWRANVETVCRHDLKTGRSTAENQMAAVRGEIELPRVLGRAMLEGCGRVIE